MWSACFIACRSVSYRGVIEILLSHTHTHTLTKHTTRTCCQIFTQSKTTHKLQSKIHTHKHTHTISINTHTYTDRGQSNKQGVSAVVITGLSMVREPLRCFLIVSLQLSVPDFFLIYIYCCIYTERCEGWEWKWKERK